jgi:N-acetyl-gamma-glutamyl-phosphate reductase
MMTINVVVIGARGYTGSELLPLLFGHPDCRVLAVGSSSVAGEAVNQHIQGMPECSLSFSDIRPENLSEYPADLYILALPNGLAGAYVEVVDQSMPGAVIIDISADYRFDDTWVYAQPERFAEKIAGAKRIANPGCYATGAQLGLGPVVGNLVSMPVVFGVSGFSGAGKTPSRKNDPEVLRDNLLPYSLNSHLHEQEVSRHLRTEVRFLPHVAAFFRGISLTIAAELDYETDADHLLSRYSHVYENCPLISVQPETPEVKEISEKHGVIIGGFSVHPQKPTRISIVCVLDNLLKGAATQVIQNMNLAFGFSSLAGLEPGRGENRDSRLSSIEVEPL